MVSVSFCQVLIANLDQALSYSAQEYFWLPESVNNFLCIQWISKGKKNHNPNISKLFYCCIFII